MSHEPRLCRKGLHALVEGNLDACGRCSECRRVSKRLLVAIKKAKARPRPDAHNCEWCGRRLPLQGEDIICLRCDALKVCGYKTPVTVPGEAWL